MKILINNRLKLLRSKSILKKLVFTYLAYICGICSLCFFLEHIPYLLLNEILNVLYLKGIV